MNFLQANIALKLVKKISIFKIRLMEFLKKFLNIKFINFFLFLIILFIEQKYIGVEMRNYIIPYITKYHFF